MLTDENIAKINAILDDHKVMGMTTLGAKYSPGNTLSTKKSMMGNFLVMLRHQGVDIPRRPGAGGSIVPPAELAEFRAWKAQQQRIAAE